MMDFTQSLKIGLQAAQEQIEKRNEIQTVFRHLSEQISQYLKFNIEIFPDGQALVMTTKESIDITPPKRKVLPRLRASKHKKYLASWADTDDAYPCSIAYGNEEFLCENKKDLELALSTMLQNADIAEQLLNFKAENEVSL